MSHARYERVYSSLTNKDKKRLVKTVLPRRRWGTYFEYYCESYDLEDKDDFRRFGYWFEDRSKTSQADYTHNKPYWYDEDKESYIVYLKSKKSPIVLKESIWASIKDAYSNWDGAPSSINEICRKFGLARNTLTELLRAMGMTHDSSPWTDQTMEETPEEDLIEELLRKKEEKILIKSERREYRRVQKDAQNYRSLSLFAKEINSHFTDGPKLDIPKLKLNKADKPYCVLVSPTDFHWGKYATSMFGDGYNRDIAEERLFDCTNTLLSRLSLRGEPEKIILGIGGDGLHIDNQYRGTTRGTPQDCDGNPTELAHTYVDLCRRYISFVAQFGKVEVFVVPGNHDYYTSALLRAALMGWFHSAENVEVIENLSSRQTFLYGDSLISFIHGDDGNVKDYASIIAGESPKMWGKSEQRFIFTGHLHTERELPQFGNITVYRMPSLAGTDDWHHKKGYKSRKALIGYVIDKKEGVVATEIVPVKKEQ